MAKNIELIKAWTTKKLEETSNELNEFKIKEENTDVGMQFHFLTTRFEKKWKTMFCNLEYNRILAIINDNNDYLENMVESLTYQLLECKPMRSSSDPITSITSVWETEMQQKLLREYKAILKQANKEE